MNAVEIRGVSFGYGRREVLSGLDLSVRRGEVYGLVGPNGAGKTTTLRLLAGLEEASAGVVSVLGEPMPAARRTVLRDVGALIDAPMAYPHLTGRENLEIVRRVRELPAQAVERALERVGLVAAADRRVREFSLGMKQRLGVAGALLHEPQLLVLDEPGNALDPGAAVELRQLLRRQAAEGRTVLISSHHLAELERVVDRVGILVAGKLDYEGTLAGLADTEGTWVRIGCREPGRARDLLGPVALAVEAVEGGVRARVDDAARAPEINRLLVSNGIDVSALAVERTDLEAVFLARVAAAGGEG